MSNMDFIIVGKNGQMEINFEALEAETSLEFVNEIKEFNQETEHFYNEVVKVEKVFEGMYNKEFRILQKCINKETNSDSYYVTQYQYHKRSGRYTLQFSMGTYQMKRLIDWAGVENA